MLILIVYLRTILDGCCASWKRRSNLVAFLVESTCGNAALSSVCAQGKDSDGHATDGPGSTLGWLRIGGSRIKWRPHVSLPRTVDRSRIKWRSDAERDRASGRIPTVDDTSHTMAAA
ncbi:hypothetical protein GW17_00061665 [Ensete ventricosum]|nr:hypothetical protein GW17_00061665 [Ensete ventricosum]